MFENKFYSFLAKSLLSQGLGGWGKLENKTNSVLISMEICSLNWAWQKITNCRHFLIFWQEEYFISHASLKLKPWMYKNKLLKILVVHKFNPQHLKYMYIVHIQFIECLNLEYTKLECNTTRNYKTLNAQKVQMYKTWAYKALNVQNRNIKTVNAQKVIIQNIEYREAIKSHNLLNLEGISLDVGVIWQITMTE